MPKVFHAFEKVGRILTHLCPKVTLCITEHIGQRAEEVAFGSDQMEILGNTYEESTGPATRKISSIEVCPAQTFSAPAI
jgi:hypothetical protein